MKDDKILKFVATTEDDGHIDNHASDETIPAALTRWLDECANDEYQACYPDGLTGQFEVDIYERIDCESMTEEHPYWEESHDPESGKRYDWIMGITVGTAVVVWTVLDEDDENPTFKIQNLHLRTYR